jgi:addiction module HigA family antidote
MYRRNRRPTTPGVVLHEHYLAPRGLTIKDFAAACGVSRKHISNIIHGRAAITSETAVRFATVLDTTPELWLNLQNAVDLYDAKQRLHAWKPAELHSAMAIAV